MADDLLVTTKRLGVNKLIFIKEFCLLQLIVDIDL